MATDSEWAEQVINALEDFLERYPNTSLPNKGSAMTVENCTIQQAIEKSEQEDRVVRMHYSEFRHSQLFLASDDCNTDSNQEEWEYWTESWRIHLVRHN